MSKTPELLPCPFCGGEANMNRPIERVPNIQVACLNCRAGFYRTLTNDTEMTELWNTRVYQPEVQTAIERDTPLKTINKDQFGVSECPKCKADAQEYQSFCFRCGQRLDWSEE